MLRQISGNRRKGKEAQKNVQKEEETKTMEKRRLDPFSRFKRLRFCGGWPTSSVLLPRAPPRLPPASPFSRWVVGGLSSSGPVDHGAAAGSGSRLILRTNA